MLLIMSHAISQLDEPILVEDNILRVGEVLPFFQLVNHALEDITLESFQGKRKILHFFPGIDTPASADSVRRLDALGNTIPNTVILNISPDLPFTMTRFAEAEHLVNSINLSSLRGRDMFKNYGVLIMSSKLAGLPARALMVADENDMVLHVELVDDLTREPDFEAALKSLTGH
jgi:thioredoxin-dependent peroxiredoxin